MIEPPAEHLLAAGAALEDLEPAEAEAWGAHRAGCVACRALEGDLAAVLVDLSLAVPERIPPPDLLDAVRRAIRADGTFGPVLPFMPVGVEPPAVEPAAAGTAAPASLDDARVRHVARGGARRGALGGHGAILGIAAALAIAAVGLGARSIALQGDLDRVSTRIGSLQARLSGQDVAIVAAVDPGRVAVALHAEPLAPAAAATVMYVPGSSRAVVVVDGLPATPPGRAYQLWYADAAGVHPLQTVSFDGNGSFIEPLGVDLSTAAAVMITLEDAGGATGDPGPQVVFGQL